MSFLHVVRGGLPLLIGLTAALGTAAAGELTLAGAVALGLASGEVDARRFAVAEARAEARVAALRPDPTLTYDRQDIFDEGVAPGFVQNLVKVEQALPARKLRHARRELGAQQVAAAEAAVAVTQRKRELEVRHAFVRALTAQHEIGAYEHTRERVKGLGTIISARVAAGESSDYERARITLAQAQEEDAQDAAQVELANRRAELAAAMGSPIDAGTQLAGTIADATPDSLVIDARVAAALAALDLAERGAGGTAGATRPEVLELQTRTAVAAAAARVTRAQGRPQLTVGGGYMHFDQTGLPDQSGYNAIAAVVLPLPERRSAQADAARARADGARAELLATIRRVRGEITGAREAVRAAAGRLQRLTRTQEAQLEPLLQMSRTSYQAGLQSLLELLDAYRLEREFHVQRLRARGVLTEALEDLNLSIGLDVTK